MAQLAMSSCMTAVPAWRRVRRRRYTSKRRPAQATPDLHVPSSEPRYAAIVVDASYGEVLYEKRANSPRYPASITKIMTLYLAFEALATGKLKETDLISVSPLAAARRRPPSWAFGPANHHRRRRHARDRREVGQRHGHGAGREDRRHREPTSPP